MSNQNISEFIHTNRLIHETSPYLLQHAHNPGGLVSLGRGGVRAGAG